MIRVPPVLVLATCAACVPPATLIASGDGGWNDGGDDARVIDACPVDAGAGTWTSLAPMPQPSYALGAAFVRGKLYAIGGFATTRVAAYDPCTNVWTQRAPLPIRSPAILQYFGVATIGDAIFVVAGDDGNGSAVNTLYKYDAPSDVWSVLAPLPTTGIARPGAGAIDGVVYAVGGVTGSTQLDTLYAYDSAANAWSKKSRMPTARSGAATAVIGGKLYVAGGGATSGPTDVLEVYDPASDSWSRGAPMPVTKVGAGAAIGTLMYAPGGLAGVGTTNAVIVYDAVADSWSTLAKLPTARYDMGVAADRDGKTLYAIGGYDGMNTMSTNEAYAP